MSWDRRAPLFVLVLIASIITVQAGTEAVVLSDDGQRTVLEFVLGDYGLRPVDIRGETFAAIDLAGEGVLLEEGAPALPVVARSVIVADQGQVTVRVLSAECSARELPVAPSKGNLLRTVDPESLPYRFGPAYAADAFWPASLATAGEPYVMRDHRGVALRVTPFQYNPVRRELRVCQRIQVEVATSGRGGPNPLTSRPPRAARAFNEIYIGHFLNFGARQAQMFYPPVDEDGELLIIANDAWTSNLGPFVSHKISVGIPTTVTGVSTIGNDADSIRNYIRDFYNTHNLAFVLLVGDSAQVATKGRQVSGENGASDAYYSKLAGTDNYPDVIVGRFSAANTAQLDTQVQRSVDYEELPATTQAWFKKAVGIASAEGAGQGDQGQSDIAHLNEIRGWLLGDEYTQVDQIYDPGASDTQVKNALNDGRGVVNYCGHGSATSWGTTGFNNDDVNSLVNKDRLPFIFSVACNNGEFHHYDACFGEAWLRASKDGRPTGAVAVYASSVSQSWAPPMEAEDEFNLRLTDTNKPYHTIGALFYAGSSSMMDAYGNGGVDMFDTWVIFGDPSLRVVGTVVPTGMTVEPEEGLAAQGRVGGVASPASQVYTIRNLAQENAIEIAVSSNVWWATVEPDHVTIGPAGSATVTVSVAASTPNLDIGSYAGNIRFDNLSAEGGNTSRSVSVVIDQHATVRSWPLGSDPGWVRQGAWEFGVPAGKGGGFGSNPDPLSGATGPNVFGVNLEGNIPSVVGGPYALVLGPIDLTGVNDASLRFQRWLNTLGPPQVESFVEVSNDSAHWVRVWAAEANVLDASWQPQAFDISAVADNQPNVWVRWAYKVNRLFSVIGSGWNIDDIEILGAPSSARISLLVQGDQLTWNPLQGATGYDIVRGDVAALLATGGDFTSATEGCIANDWPTPSVAYAELPPAGGCRWILVRGVTGADVLTYQSLARSQVGLRDAEIAAAPAACP